MNTDKAIHEAQRWLGYLDAQEAKAKRLAELARLAKTDHAEALRQKRQMDAAPTVYDGGNLEPAVRFLIAEIEQLNAWREQAKTWEREATLLRADLGRHQEDTEQQIEAMVRDKDAKITRLREALQSFANIEVPHGADSATWVARTLHCNNQVTAMQVWKARAALAGKEDI